MSTVGQYLIRAFTGPFASESKADMANTVRGNDNILRAMFNSHDADTSLHVQSSVIAARPAAGVAGRLWLTSDTMPVRLWYDTGAAWAQVGL